MSIGRIPPYPRRIMPLPGRKFLRDKLPDILTESQKKNKVTNLLSALRIKGTIRNNGYSKWSPV